VTKLLAKDGEGERLDRFELITELASGGMATVYLARLSGVAGFQRLVAIKRLHPHLAREPEFIEMFLDEARLAARIHHPNVVPIQEVGESDSGYYLVMDYVEGDTFARVLARASQSKATVPHGVTIRVLLDVLAGLHAAHQLVDDHGQPLEIVHRDVSPQNILVGADGVARLVDFGVARAASRLSTTRSGQLKGKLAYMAPEQARGKGVDRRADLFSCGIVLWEALALKRLFKGDGEAETLNRVLYDEIAPPSSVRDDVPKALEDVCMKALQRDIDQRYATAQDFADALEAAARSLSCIGSVRDVAATLDQVLGTDISQQRDAVRAWLSRSEPSHTGPRSRPDPTGPQPQAKESVVTRVEGGSTPSSASKRGPAETSRPQIDRFAVTAPAPPELLTGAVNDKVSSVSSAVLQMPDVSSVNASSSLKAQPRSKGRLVIALAAIVVVLGASAWGAKSYVVKNAPTNAGLAPASTAPATRAPAPTTTAAQAPAAQAPAATTATAEPSASATPSASASAVATTTASAHPKPLGRPGGGTRSQGVSRPTGNVPDDMSKNPYR